MLRVRKNKIYKSITCGIKSLIVMFVITMFLPHVGHAAKGEPPDLDLWLSPDTPSSSVSVMFSSSANYRDPMDGGSWEDSLGNRGTISRYTEYGVITTVTQNCTVTVEVQDLGSRSTTKTITVSNIDSTPPQIDLTPTSITLPVIINVNATDIGGAGVVLKKWAAGSQNKSFFSNGGTVLSGDTFTVDTNGTYTVYAKDAAGNDAIKTIDISASSTSGYTYHYHSNGRVSYIETPQGIVKYIYDSNGNLISKKLTTQ